MTIGTSTEVECPSEQLFAYVTDPGRFGEWQDGIVEGHMEGGGHVVVGSRCITTRRIGLAKRAVTAEVTRLEPPRRWTLHGIDGPIRADVDVTVEPLAGDRRSRLTIEIDFVGRGIGKVIVPLLVRPQARREMPRNVQRLKLRLEAASSSAGRER